MSEKQLKALKVTAFMAYHERHGFLGLYLFEEEDKTVTINAERCRKVIKQFCYDLNASLTLIQVCRTWLIKDEAPPHTVQDTIAYLHQLFNIRIISLTTDYE